MKLLSVIELVILMAMVGCKKEGEGSATPEGQTAAASGTALIEGGDFLGNFDSKAELSALQGVWQVHDTLSGKSTWEINGDKMTRKLGDQIEEGTIEVTSPGRVSFVQSKGEGTMRSYWGYARNGNELYIGLGQAGMKVGERYMVDIDGLLVKAGETCKFYERDVFGGGYKKEGLEVKCELKDEGDKKMLNYTVPDLYQKGEMKAGQVFVVGNALLDEQMMGNKAEKAIATP